MLEHMHAVVHFCNCYWLHIMTALGLLCVIINCNAGSKLRIGHYDTLSHAFYSPRSIAQHLLHSTHAPSYVCHPKNATLHKYLCTNQPLK